MEQEKKWIKIRAIVELVGKPLEHIQNTIIMMGEKFGEGTPEIKVTKRQVKPPVKVENTEMYSAYLEFEADVKNLSTVMGIIFDYMPSSIEIIAPESITEDIPNLNALLNDLAGRLHQYDMTIKKLKAQYVLQKKELLKAKKDSTSAPVSTDTEEPKS